MPELSYFDNLHESLEEHFLLEKSEKVRQVKGMGQMTHP
ncbi:MAG: hypothetical protein CENE_02701 [Candidatus Celerinatantimonas neptuna]|nr:MAG: hypothetical protein CENE_02701 [Candidatus Celerinatantimonas neptuna]